MWQLHADIFLVAFVICLTEVKTLTPVILVPGDAGSQIDGKWNKPGKPPHTFCSKVQKKYTSLWVNEVSLLPLVVDCWVDNIRLVYNRTSHTTSNSPGVETRIPGFGKTKSVEWLVKNPVLPTKLSFVAYFNTIVDSLVKKGYVRGKSVRAAPYDFRKAPNEQAEYFKNFKQLVEETYKLNNNTKVAIVAHSMGNPMMLYFYNHVTQSWKDTYIKTHIGLAGVWAGAVKLLRLFASGETLGPLGYLIMRAQQRTMVSSAWLMPSNTTWSANEVLVVSPKRNYTVNNYRQFFDDIGFMDGWYMRQDTEGLIHSLEAPGLEVHCLHGSGVGTPGVLLYNSKSWYDKQPKLINDDGDGAINIRSLTKCLDWKGQQTQKIYHQAYPKVTHKGILHDTNVVKYIKNALFP